jgi:hypothetical protein
MTNPQIQRVEVSNLAEVEFLLNYAHHKIVDVGLKTSWPHGVVELCVTLEGRNIELDHHSYMRHGGCNLERLPGAFDAVKSMLWRKVEAAAEGGRS